MEQTKVLREAVAEPPSRRGEAAKRVRVSQTDVPAHSLDDALRVAFAISEEYGKRPTRPIEVATALQMMPTGGQFKSLTGASVAYGITDGGGQAYIIELTDPRLAHRRAGRGGRRPRRTPGRRSCARA